MTYRHFRRHGFRFAACAIGLISSAGFSLAQSSAAADAIVQGQVRDARSQPLANAAVALQPASPDQSTTIPKQTTRTDSHGAYRFVVPVVGSYTLRAEMSGYGESKIVPLTLAEKETRTVDLVLVPRTTPKKAGVSAPEFFDEPQFTVAGVAQASNPGGHGSDVAMRNTEALAKATLSLSKEPGPKTQDIGATEAALRAAVTRQPDSFDTNKQMGAFLASHDKTTEALPYLQRAVLIKPDDAETHRLLGDVQEKAGRPLEAVREYERAAELDPTEANLFDWGTELLVHRAWEPATEVFAKANRLFPKSVRTLIALGVTWYARGSSDRAAQYLAKASDLAPDDPTPYVFLGRMQSVEAAPSDTSVTLFARFAQVQPDNARANYYYAVALWKQNGQSTDAAQSARVESLLLKAVHLDPNLAAAYLLLGKVYSQRGDLPQAAHAYQSAISSSPKDELNQDYLGTLQEAHYRLGQTYERMGDKEQAQVELKLYSELVKKNKADAATERANVQQFVISLREKTSSSPQN